MVGVALAGHVPDHHDERKPSFDREGFNRCMKAEFMEDATSGARYRVVHTKFEEQECSSNLFENQSLFLEAVSPDDTEFYLAEYRTRGLTMLIKSIKPTFALDYPHLVRMEECIGKATHHPNIRRLYCAYWHPLNKTVNLVMEWIPGLNLLESITVKESIKGDVVASRALLEQMGSALSFLHSNGIVHRDVKPQNILIRENEPLSFFLIDFAMAAILDPVARTYDAEPAGTLIYFAPEILRILQGEDIRCTSAVDWYSLGLTLYIQLSGQMPLCYSDFKDIETLKEALRNAEIDLKPICEAFRPLVTSLITKQPTERGDLASIKKWFDSLDFKANKEVRQIVSN